MKSEFTRNEYELAYPDGAEDHYWNLARNHILGKTIAAHIEPADKIIEIGCGRGGVVKYLNHNGLDCFGVELAQCVPYPGAEEYVETETNALDIADVKRSNFTVLLLLDVLEHIENPRSFLDAILNKYENIRMLVITVPARKEIWSEYDEFYGHQTRYDLEMSAGLIKASGFRIVQIGYFFNGLYAAARLALSLSAKRAVKVSSPRGIAKHIHKALSFWFILEYYLTPARLRGSSIIGVGVK